MLLLIGVNGFGWWWDALFMRPFGCAQGDRWVPAELLFRADVRDLSPGRKPLVAVLCRDENECVRRQNEGCGIVAAFFLTLDISALTSRVMYIHCTYD